MNNKALIKLDTKRGVVTLKFLLDNYDISKINKLPRSEELLTIDRNFDNMLITSLDKLTSRNTMERLSLKSLEIEGKIDHSTVSGMILASVGEGLKS